MNTSGSEIKILAGNSSKELAQKIEQSNYEVQVKGKKINNIIKNAT